MFGGAYGDPQFNEKHKFVLKAKSGPGVLQVAQLSRLEQRVGRIHRIGQQEVCQL